MSKKNKEFEDKWNKFCKKVRFICCCGCNLEDNDLYDSPEPIEITSYDDED